MILFTEISADQRLHRHAEPVEHDAEFDQTDDHGEGYQSRLAEAARNKSDQNVVHQRPAQIDRGIDDAVARGQKKIPE